MPEASASYLPNDQALIKLITDRSVDVAVVAAGQPAPIIANMKSTMLQPTVFSAVK